MNILFEYRWWRERIRVIFRRMNSTHGAGPFRQVEAGLRGVEQTDEVESDPFLLGKLLRMKKFKKFLLFWPLSLRNVDLPIDAPFFA